MITVPYKKYIAGAALALILVFSANLYVGHKEKISYDKGFEEANSAWMIKGKEYVDMLDKSYLENQKLNAELALKNGKDSQEDFDRRVSTAAAQVDLARDPASTKRTMNKKFVDLYNLSLGE